MNDKYDVIIIGAGIGGLVCGCYLAKAGLKVLIVEQHSIPGGYCTSFKRKGFIFDVGVHYLGSCRNGGILDKILNDLSIENRIKLLRTDLCDRIITPDKTVYFHQDKNKTKEELIRNFPKEKRNIILFFDKFLNEDFLAIVGKTKNLTFRQLIDSFFADDKLRAILSMPLVGNLGLEPQFVSALISVVLYKEFLLDGGYYPEGGIQTFPDALMNRFVELGGEIIFSTRATKIFTKNKKISGVQINNTDIITTQYVVSNADATLTFKTLLDCQSPETALVEKLKTSPSAFVVYLGINKNLKNLLPKHHITWHFSDYKFNHCYGRIKNNKFTPSLNYTLYSFPSLVDESLAPKNKDIVRIFQGAQFVNANYWKTQKKIFYDTLINKANKIIPGIKDSIEVFETATPMTFYRYTSNKNGALFGWAPLVSQINRTIFPTKTSIKNLYLAGHWVTNGVGQGGIAVVALSGKYAAQLISKNNKT
jgi:phytoene dehydrogenase-like protein